MDAGIYFLYFHTARSEINSAIYRHSSVTFCISHKTKARMTQNKPMKNTDIVAPELHIPLRRSNMLIGENNKSNTPIPITVRRTSISNSVLNNVKSKQFAPEIKYSIPCICLFRLLELLFFFKLSPSLNKNYL